jgi:anti-anti-sigma factor
MHHELDAQRRTLRVVFPGNVLSNNASVLKDEIFAALPAPEARASGWDWLEADLNAATMIDSVGLNLLAGLIKIAEGRGKRLRIQVASPNVRRVLKFTRLDQIAEVVGA